MTKISKLVPMKHLKASFIEQTIGSPLMLKEVFTKIGQPDISLNFFKFYPLLFFLIHPLILF